jgi:hypothetical protein
VCTWELDFRPPERGGCVFGHGGGGAVVLIARALHPSLVAVVRSLDLASVVGGTASTLYRSVDFPNLALKLRVLSYVGPQM